MRTLIVGLFLAVFLVSAGVSGASFHENQEGDYVAAPFASSTDVTVQALGFHADASVGAITVDIAGWERLAAGVHDEASTSPKVYYSFHPGDPQVGLFGEPLDAVGVGIFCSSDVLEVPEDASVLRMSLNAPSGFDSVEDCPGGMATTGEWFVQERSST